MLLIRTESAEYSVMHVNEVRARLKAAIRDRGETATALSRKLKRSQGYLSDFFRGKKETLAAAESAALEHALRLPPGSLLVSDRTNSIELAATATSVPNAAAPSQAPNAISSDTPQTGNDRIEVYTLQDAIDFAISFSDELLKIQPDKPSSEEIRALAVSFARSREADSEFRKNLSKLRSRKTPTKDETHKDSKSEPT